MFTPNFGAVRRIVWSEAVDFTRYASRYDSGVVVQLASGGSMRLPALAGTADDLLDLLRRCAAQAAAKC